MWINKRLMSGDVHVMPLDDLMPHEFEDCACGPVDEPCPRKDGSMGWLITHNSLDGREKDE
jgi:hypothetical protein